MSGVDLLLDTNAAIALIREEPAAMEAVLFAECPAISLFTLGELEFGALKSSRKAESSLGLVRVRTLVSIVNPDESVAQHYAHARRALRMQGRPIPENDLWIAAMALSLGIPLMTKDAHFAHLPQLLVVGW